METNALTSETPASRQRRPRKLIIALAAIAALVCILAAAFLVYAGDYYRDADTQRLNLASTESLPVEQGNGYLAFGDPNAQVGLVFYPGAKVEYSAYAPLMRDLAERGYFAVVAQMPFNFAFFDINAADRVRATFPNVKTWWVGGHSLGGSMAAQYAANHADDPALDGVLMLAAYSASDLSQTDLGIVCVYGSNDQVLDRGKLKKNSALLPSGELTLELAGGNHANFGTYGSQRGDGQAQMDPEEQRSRTADAFDNYVSEHADAPGAAPQALRDAA